MCYGEDCNASQRQYYNDNTSLNWSCLCSLPACPRSQWRKKKLLKPFLKYTSSESILTPLTRQQARKKIDRPERGHDPSTRSVESLRPNKIQMDVAASALVEV